MAFMGKVDNVRFDMAAFELYARRSAEISTFFAEFGRVVGTSLLAYQTQILNITPQYSATTLLFGLQQKIRFGRIEIPIDTLPIDIRSPYLVPSLYSNEMIEITINKIRAVESDETAMRQLTGSDLITREDRANIMRGGEAIIKVLEALVSTNKGTKETTGFINQFLHA